MDTQKITNAILATGLTQQELADLVPCGQSTIAAFVTGKRGRSPTYAIATRLLEIHAERCEAGPEPAPVSDHPPRTPPNRDRLMTTAIEQPILHERCIHDIK